MRRVLAAIAVFFVTLMSSGCVIVPQKAGRIQAPSGQIFQEKIDLGFLKEGVSRREVTARLGQFDVGFTSERLFIARWADSTRWRVDFYESPSQHEWRLHTLFIEFDESDLVKRFAHVSDRELLRAVAAWTASEPPLTLRPPIRLSVRYRDYVVRFGSNSLQFEDTKNPKYNFSVQVADVRWLEFEGLYWAPGTLPEAGWVQSKIAFRKKTPVGRSAWLGSDLPTLIKLVRFAELAQIPLKEKSSGEKKNELAGSTHAG